LAEKLLLQSLRLRSAALNRPMQMTRTQNIRKTGFTLVELMIVVAIIGLLAAIAIPSFVKARATSQANACINNLRQIDGAANEWAMDTGQTTGASCWLFRNLSSYLSGIPNIASGNYVCPAGGNYIDPITIGNNPTCSLGNMVTPAHILP
jgi:prepilin-type N-terminal cleavage/methylation domain-containing protein